MCGANAPHTTPHYTRLTQPTNIKTKTRCTNARQNQRVFLTKRFTKQYV